MERRRRDHERARALNLTLFWILETTDIAPIRERCVVRSQSQPESAHEVALTWDVSGPLVVCGCIGFQQRGICVHSATVEVTLIGTGEMRDPFALVEAGIA